MSIDVDRVASALASKAHSVAKVAAVVRRFLDAPEESYEDHVAFESFRAALVSLGQGDRKRRAVELASAWDGDADPERRVRFARIGFAQGIDYHHLDGEAPRLFGPSFAPISWYDVEGLMSALSFIGGAGEHLAATIAFAAFDERDPRVLEWFRQADADKPSTRRSGCRSRRCPTSTIVSSS